MEVGKTELLWESKNASWRREKKSKVKREAKKCSKTLSIKREEEERQKK